jgi:structural maintenance of chromosome 2
MQGRITKVLNMKPIEILSMIEETAGTRMYEIKKQSALKTIEKKQLKVNELSEILNHDITPRLEQLRCDKLNYQEWSNGHHEIERLEKLCVVYEYQEAEMKVLNTENYQNEMKLEILNFTNEQKELMKRNELLENDLKQIEMKREQEQEGEYQELKKREQEMSKELVKINTNYQNMKLNLLKEKEVNDGNLQQIAQTEEILLLKKHEFQQQEGFVLEAQRGIEKMQQEIEVQQLKYQNACAGVVTTTTTVGTDGGGGSILSDVETMSTLTVTEQIGLWETKLRESQSQQQQGKMKQKYQQKKLKELVEIRKPQEERKHLEEMEKLNELREEIQTLEKKIKKMNPTASSSSSSSSSSLSPSEREERLQEQHVALRSQMESLSDQIETMTTQIQTRLNFEFRDPERGFDRNRVKGLVASLIHVKESAQHATALEIAAGNKLYQVVVDNEQTGKLLLGKGILKKRVTILPLNKISNRVLDDNKLSLASSIARGKHGTAELALELIGYDEEVTRAMQHVFGNAIICSSNQIAEAIAFDPKIRCRTITFDGDTFDPSGTVTGGSRNQIGALLMKMSELNDLRGRYEELSQENQKIERELDNLNQLSQQFSETNQTLQRKLQERQILEERISSGAYSQLCQEIEGLEREIQQFDQVPLSSSLLSSFPHDRFRKSCQVCLILRIWLVKNSTN